MDIRGSTNAELDMPRLSLSADYRSVGSWTTYLLLTMFRREYNHPANGRILHNNV